MEGPLLRHRPARLERVDLPPASLCQKNWNNRGGIGGRSPILLVYKAFRLCPFASERKHESEGRDFVMKTRLSIFWGKIIFGGCCLLASGTAAWGNQVEALREGALLKVFGDNAANDIAITQNANGDVTVSGRNGTLINGLASARFPRMVLNAVEIDLAGGNDVVAISNLRIANDLNVKLGDGSNRLLTGASPSAVGANVSIEGGLHSDMIRLTNWIVGGDVAIDGKFGVLDAVLTGLNVGFNLTLVGDTAADIINVRSCTVAGTTSIAAKDGANRINVTDLLSVNLFVLTDFGNDLLTLTGVAAAQDIEVFTGKGDDRVTMSSVFVGKNLRASLDEGIDSFQGSNTTVTYDAVFEGGAGIDTFKDLGISAGVKKEIKEFERF